MGNACIRFSFTSSKTFHSPVRKHFVFLFFFLLWYHFWDLPPFIYFPDDPSLEHSKSCDSHPPSPPSLNKCWSYFFFSISSSPATEAVVLRGIVFHLLLRRWNTSPLETSAWQATSSLVLINTLRLLGSQYNVSGASRNITPYLILLHCLIVFILVHGLQNVVSSAKHARTTFMLWVEK